MSAKRDVYEEITQTIIKAIEQSAGDFQMPWHRGGMRPTNALTHAQYRGINILQLSISQHGNSFDSPYWATYKQWQELGAKVKKGAKGTEVIFYKTLIAEQKAETQLDQSEPEQPNEEGEDDQQAVELKKFPMLKTSVVFNADQIDGWNPPEIPLTDKTQHLENAETFIEKTGAEVRHGGERAFYNSSGDFIQMPNRERFTGTDTSTATEAYYSVLLHELTHWTGHAKRCHRDLGNRFGNEAYAMEELIAELGASFLCADLQVAVAVRPDHAQYIQSWLKVLREDKTAIFTASNRAMKAIDFLHGLQDGSIKERQYLIPAEIEMEVLGYQEVNQATDLIAEMHHEPKPPSEEERAILARHEEQKKKRLWAKSLKQGKLF